jgi:hypothetical protein
MRRLIVSALLCVPAALVAQESTRTVSPGMNRTQVIAALGAPATERTASEYTYLFYRNSCGRACGMNDLVVLRSDSVVDAIFRSPERHYAGTSSSPAPIIRQSGTHRRAKKPARAHRDSTAAAPTTTTSPAPRKKMTAPPPNDTRPSIPLDKPALKPAPTPAATPAPTKKPTP